MSGLVPLLLCYLAVGAGIGGAVCAAYTHLTDHHPESATTRELAAAVEPFNARFGTPGWALVLVTVAAFAWPLLLGNAIAETITRGRP